MSAARVVEDLFAAGRARGEPLGRVVGNRGGEVRVVFPPHLAWLAERYEETARNELGSPRPSSSITFLVLQAAAGAHARTRTDRRPGGYDEAHYAFGATRFQVLYRRWLMEGDTTLEGISSGAVAEAIKRGGGCAESHVLPFSYRHLSPLVGSTRRASKGAEEGEDGPAPSRPPLGSSTLAPELSVERATHTSA